MRIRPALALMTLLLGTPARADEAKTPSVEVVPVSAVKWEQLNPARGDKSPRAGTLWGDRKGEVPTGFLVQFVDGFSSPPHIHNVTYRGFVISGLVHNDDPDAAHMWMPVGSYWTQPKGESHITAARGKTNIAFIEIDSGPYLVRPAPQAFDSGERPYNVSAPNVVWLDGSTVGWLGGAAGQGPRAAFLWGDPQGSAPYGVLLRLPAGFAGGIEQRGSIFRAVVVSGQADYAVSGRPTTLEPGSYFSAGAPATHRVSVGAAAETIIYVRTNGPLAVSSGR